MADLAPSSGERAISFGPFRLLPEQRLLLEGDKPVRLGSRALDMLIALVEHPGEVVGKDELMARVWPNTRVDEGNLKFQIGVLRRGLGDGHAGNRYIATIPGRGYSFVSVVRVTEEALPAALQTASARGLHNLPASPTRLVGRTETAIRLAEQLRRHRLLTIVGTGGIGKTSLALAVAEMLIEVYEHGVWLIDLAPLGNSSLVPSTVASAIGMEVRSEDPMRGLLALLRDKRMLLVLDNCEHVIDAAAALASGVLQGAPGLNILATSREPLRVQGERVHRLAPLPTPATAVGVTAAGSQRRRRCGSRRFSCLSSARRQRWANSS